MPHSPRISDLAADTMLDALTALLNTGYLRIYSGVQPATANTGLSGNVLLATLRFGSPAFGVAAGGVASANAITPDASMAASGLAAFARLLKSDGSSVILDLTVGTTLSDINFDSVNFQQGAQCSLGALVLTHPEL